jgi:Lon protease-like protein
MLVRGIGRAQILEENREGSYRVARLETIHTYCTAGVATTQELRERLFATIRTNPALEDEIRQTWLQWEDDDLDLSILADVLSAGVPASSDLRQCLLAEPDAQERAQMVLEQLGTIAGHRQTAAPAGRGPIFPVRTETTSTRTCYKIALPERPSDAATRGQ